LIISGFNLITYFYGQDFWHHTISDALPAFISTISSNQYFLILMNQKLYMTILFPCIATLILGGILGIPLTLLGLEKGKRSMAF
jgi:hypothetical protein